MDCDQNYVIRTLKALIDGAGSQKAVSVFLEITPQYLNDIIRGRREISAQVAHKLGFEKVIFYRVYNTHRIDPITSLKITNPEIFGRKPHDET